MSHATATATAPNLAELGQCEICAAPLDGDDAICSSCDHEYHVEYNAYLDERDEPVGRVREDRRLQD